MLTDIFQVCNQFPIVAMRLNDARHSRNTISGTLEKYRAAWSAKQGGMIDPTSGLFSDMWMEAQNFVVPAKDPGWTAWACSMMNAWNSETVRSLFPKQSAGYITTINGETRLHPPEIGIAIRSLVAEEDADPSSATTLEKAKQNVKNAPPPTQPARYPYTKPIFGYASLWLSELGETSELDSLLKYADENLRPIWENGGLYYPRNDTPFDEDFNWTHMDPFTGNAAIGYARLNVEDGVKTMVWDRPWTSDDLKARPLVDAVTLADGVDFLRGLWDPDRECLVMTVTSWDGKTHCIQPVFRNLPKGRWEVAVTGIEREDRMVEKDGGAFGIEVQVGGEGEEVDIVVRKGE
jgi:hypothetical protein